MSNKFYYVVLDSLGNLMRTFQTYDEAEVFWVNRGGAMGGWKIRKRISKY